MRCNRITGPNRADLARRLITDSEDKIHDRCAGSGELVPTFAAQSSGPQMQPFEQIKSERVHIPLWKAAGAVSVEAPIAPMLDQAFGQDAARRVARAEEQE